MGIVKNFGGSEACGDGVSMQKGSAWALESSGYPERAVDVFEAEAEEIRVFALGHGVGSC
jgi:hypothetical protein